MGMVQSEIQLTVQDFRCTHVACEQDKATKQGLDGSDPKRIGLC